MIRTGSVRISHRLALQDLEKERLFLRASDGSFAARVFAENRLRTQRGRLPVSMPEEGVPSFAGCDKRGLAIIYKPEYSKFVPVAKDAFPGVSLVATSDKAFAQIL